MTPRHKSEVLQLAAAIALTRYLFRSHYLYDLDSVNFALAMRHFDPRVYQPHPPGYFLYICLGRLLNIMLHDANLALVALSIAASCGVVIMIYKLALEWFGPSEARFAGILFLFSPLAWFHGTVALTYSVEAFFSALLGYLCWGIDRGKAAWIAPTAVVLGISAGIRPSSLLFLGPLYLFSLRHAPARRRLAGAVALGLTLTAWFVPMIRAGGGLSAYFGGLLWLWRTVPAKDTVFNSSPATSIARACTIVLIYFLFFGAASFAPLQTLRRGAPADPGKKIFTFVWIAPALCFFTFIFLKFVNSGYLLLLSAPACVWLGSWASAWYENSAWRRPFKLAAIGSCAAVNVVIFLGSPFYCSYKSVRRFEADLQGIRRLLPQAGSADDTLIVGFDSHFLGYRHAGYYLPGYATVEYPEVKLRQGTRVFSMHERDTRLLPAITVGSYSKFILFPLPETSRYREYLEQVKARLPSHSLSTIHAGRYDFVTGPISDLPLLFPATAPAPEAGVFPPLHSRMGAVNSRAHPPA